MKKLWLLTFVFCSCYLSDELPLDQDVWDYDLPKNQGMHQDSLVITNSLVNLDEFGFVEGLMIIKNDRLIFENYYSGLTRASLKNPGNAGLSITIAVVGVALDLRLLSLSDPIVDYLPEYQEIFDDYPSKAEITVEDLLTHRSGIVWNESLGTFLDTADNVFQMKQSEDWIFYSLSQPSEAPPGLRYSFNSSHGTIMTKIIENASNQNYSVFIEEQLLAPLGIGLIEIERDPSGNYNGGDGYSLSLIDWTKIGYLYFENGIWKGRRILDPNFLEEAISVKNQIQTNPTVGFNYENMGFWWGLFGDPSENRFGVPASNFFYMYSREGNSIYINQEEKIIVSIFSENFFNPIQSLRLFNDITEAIVNRNDPRQ